MRTRLMLPALLAVLVLAAAAFLLLHPAGSVSAQQILERAQAYQGGAQPAQGIAHWRIQMSQNFQPLGSPQPATQVTDERYQDFSSSKFRSVSQDSTGKIIEASGRDGAYNYTAQISGNGTQIVRVPFNADDRVKWAGPAAQPEVASLFEQFRNNPRVELEATILWEGGIQAYVLVDRSYQTQKGANGQPDAAYSGSMKMIFNAQTYALLATETSIRKDGQDIVISASRFLVDEVLPAGSPVAWDLSDLPGATLVDGKPASETAEPTFETLSQQQLAARGQAYLLKTLPEGWNLKILAESGQPTHEPYRYEVYYSGPNGQYFEMQCIGLLDPGSGFVEANFYDGIYKSANGLELHFSTSSKPDSSRGMLVAPDGMGYLLYAGFPREKTQEMVDELVKLK